MGPLSIRSEVCRSEPSAQTVAGAHLDPAAGEGQSYSGAISTTLLLQPALEKTNTRPATRSIQHHSLHQKQHELHSVVLHCATLILHILRGQQLTPRGFPPSLLANPFLAHDSPRCVCVIPHFLQRRVQLSRHEVQTLLEEGESGGGWGEGEKGKGGVGKGG